MNSSLFLKSIHVRNYRCLLDVGPLEIQQGLTLIAGQNDGGKSSWLSAISLLLENKNLEQADRSHGISSDDRVEVTGVFAATDPSDSSETTLRVTYADQRPVKELKKALPPGITASIEDQTVDQLKASIKSLAPSESTSGNKSALQERLRGLIADIPIDQYQTVWVPADPHTLRQLPRIQLFSSSTASDPEATIKTWTRDQVRAILSEDRYSKLFQLVENRVQNRVTPQFSRFSDQIRKHSDDLEGVDIKVEIDFQTVNPVSSIEFMRQGNKVEMSRTGEGRHRKTTLAIHEANLEMLKTDSESGSYMLLYDEPDSHLDYPSQHRVARLLAQQSELPNVQVVVATHSRNLIDGVPLESILVLKLNESLCTECVSLSGPTIEHSDEIAYQSEIYMSLGMSNSALLDDRVFLVVEGATESAALPILYKTVLGATLAQTGIIVFDTNGSGAAYEFAMRLRSRWGKPLVLLLDSDTKADRSKMGKLIGLGFQENLDLFFVGIKEFEDSFDDNHWAAAMNIHLPLEDPNETWTVSEFASFRGSTKFSGSVQRHISNRIGYTVSKPDLGRFLAIQSQESGIVPKEIRDCLQSANHISLNGSTLRK